MNELQNVPEVAISTLPSFAMWAIVVLFLIYGIFTFLFPQTVLSKFFGAPNLKGIGVLAPVRAFMGALPLGLAASYIIFGDQPGTALLLTVAVGSVAIGRFFSMLFDCSFSAFNFVLFLIEVALTVTAVYYVLHGFFVI